MDQAYRAGGEALPRVEVKGSNHDARATGLVDWFLRQYPDKARSDEAKQEMDQAYRAGGEVLPHVDSVNAEQLGLAGGKASSRRRLEGTETLWTVRSQLGPPASRAEIVQPPALAPPAIMPPTAAAKPISRQQPRQQGPGAGTGRGRPAVRSPPTGLVATASLSFEEPPSWSSRDGISRQGDTSPWRSSRGRRAYNALFEPRLPKGGVRRCLHF
ncbi:hypothetical protein OCS_01315 [Ophiocordyceps sinensis CO18]|nr:hypothetical protein OCS_01315 [Ophiocordyceps sinensis CO18]